MKRISNPRFTLIILIFIILVFLTNREVFACSEDVDYTIIHVEITQNGECEIDVDGHGLVKIKGTETNVKYGDKIVYMANKDEEACPDDFEVILEFTLCLP